MQGGRLDRRIDIERKTVTQDDAGQQVETWAKLVERRAASAVPVSGDERFASSQFVGQRVTEFRIRWSEDVDDVGVLDRIIYPADDSSPPPEGRTYDIKDVRELGRREGLQIFAVARSDA